jgi:peptidoglycan/LPS O-acetylase OafA/YrhL
MTLKGSESIRLNSLTGLRFLAALVVVLQHATRHFAQVPVLSELFDQGAVGVTFFFILSGFVLTWSHKPVRSKWNFYRNRFARVYPLHLLTLLLSIPLVLAAQEFSWTSLVATVLLLQAWSPDRMVQFAMNGPSWSLSCEAFFYAVFPFLITPISRLRRISIVRQAIALVAILGAVFAVLAFV